MHNSPRRPFPSYSDRPREGCWRLWAPFERICVGAGRSRSNKSVLVPGSARTICQKDGWCRTIKLI